MICDLIEEWEMENGECFMIDGPGDYNLPEETRSKITTRYNIIATMLNLPLTEGGIDGIYLSEEREDEDIELIDALYIKVLEAVILEDNIDFEEYIRNN